LTAFQIVSYLNYLDYRKAYHRAIYLSREQRSPFDDHLP